MNINEKRKRVYKKPWSEHELFVVSTPELARVMKEWKDKEAGRHELRPLQILSLRIGLHEDTLRNVIRCSTGRTEFSKADKIMAGMHMTERWDEITVVPNPRIPKSVWKRLATDAGVDVSAWL